MTGTLGALLRASAARGGERAVLVDAARTLSWREFDAGADRVAGALAGLGLARGDRVAVCCPNRVEYALLHFGCARAGVALAHVSTRASAADLARALARVSPAALFADPALPALAGASPGLRRIAIGPEFDALLAAAPQAPAVDVAPDDLLGVTFTGGTTGAPKAVASTQASRAFSAVSGAREFALAPDDVAIVGTPLFHAVGLYAWLGALVAAGATAVLSGGWSPAGFVALAERHRATAALLVPTQLGDLLRLEGLDPRRLAGLRRVHHAAAPMPPGLAARLAATFPWIRLVEHYGQSECGPIAFRRDDDPPEAACSVGRAVAGTALRVVDAEGRDCAPGVVGEVATRGPHLFSGYLGDEEATRAALRDGWLFTGDLGRLDARGFLTLVDRARDLIISGGENIFPSELEAALLRHEAVAEAAVFGVPDERWGEAPAAHVVLRPGASADEAALLAHVEREVARWKRLKLVRIVDALPRTAVGKVLKGELRAAHRGGPR